MKQLEDRAVRVYVRCWAVAERRAGATQGDTHFCMRSFLSFSRSSLSMALARASSDLVNGVGWTVSPSQPRSSTRCSIVRFERSMLVERGMSHALRSTGMMPTLRRRPPCVGGVPAIGAVYRPSAGQCASARYVRLRSSARRRMQPNIARGTTQAGNKIRCAKSKCQTSKLEDAFETPTKYYYRLIVYISFHVHEFTCFLQQIRHNSRLLQRPKWSVTERNGCNGHAGRSGMVMRHIHLACTTIQGSQMVSKSSCIERR